MSDFTPGPWHVTGYCHYSQAYDVEGPQGEMIAQTKLYDAKEGTYPALANARLIAAATDLYAACMEYVQAATDCGYVSSQRLFKQMKDALAKVDKE